MKHLLLIALAVACAALFALSAKASGGLAGGPTVDLVRGSGTVFGGIGTFSFATVSGPERGAGIASFEWGPLLGPSAWTVAIDCVKVGQTPVGRAAAIVGDVVTSSGFAPAVGTRAGFVVADGTPGGVADGLGILGPEVPSDCAEISTPTRAPVGNVSSGDITITEVGMGAGTP